MSLVFEALLYLLHDHLIVELTTNFLYSPKRSGIKEKRPTDFLAAMQSAEIDFEINTTHLSLQGICNVSYSKTLILMFSVTTAMHKIRNFF